MTTPRTVLITGASTGFGRLTALTFQRGGWNVVATMRSPEGESELTSLPNTLVVRLDVRERASVDAAVDQAVGRFGAIDVLVNNAGHGTRGFLEEASESEMYEQFDANVFGMMRTIQSVTPHMRAAGSGVIINISSISGIFGSHLNSLYSASKFAVHGLTESLAHELSLFGIDVKVISPGIFETNFLTNLKKLSGNPKEELRRYTDIDDELMAASRQRMANEGGTPSNPQEVADRIYEGATTDTPVTSMVGSDAVAIQELKTTMTEPDFMALIRSGTMQTPPEPTT